MGMPWRLQAAMAASSCLEPPGGLIATTPAIHVPLPTSTRNTMERQPTPHTLVGVDNEHFSKEYEDSWPVLRRFSVGDGGDTVVPIHPQYVVDEEQHRQAVLLPLADWERIVEELDELNDIREYDQAKAGPQETVSFEQAVREIQEGQGE